LLVLVAGLAAAGAAAAEGVASSGACCTVASDSGCPWLGSGDCCPERPGAPAQPHAAPPAAAPGCEVVLPAVTAVRAVLPARALLDERVPRTLVLRL
jgi:hypothetical protein